MKRRRWRSMEMVMFSWILIHWSANHSAGDGAGNGRSRDDPSENTGTVSSPTMVAAAEEEEEEEEEGEREGGGRRGERRRW
ncbi:hypothetical protein IHE45_15G085300 [Dioscorea alata]|uniref:Uncharacterized protein n=1 Tax=Dioscorea alata TaxID=55571 RepID=A0ACB7UMS1_DIOAL|nr:hypothetical protein IHE45_15G085300 [Dioscorea alata]